MMGTPDFIPWPVIKPRYNWAARYRDGRMFVFETRPELVNDGFALGGHWMRIDTLTTAKPGTCEWQYSLQSRDDWNKGYPDLEDVRQRLDEAYDAVKQGFENLSKSYGRMADAIREVEARTRHPLSGGQLPTASFVDRVHASGKPVVMHIAPDYVPTDIPINSMI